MKLEVDCSWNQKKNHAKVVLSFAYVPKHIFLMPDDELQNLQYLSMNSFQMGPPVLEELKTIITRYPKSLYAHFSYYKTLNFFEYEEEADEAYQTMQKQFPQTVFTKGIEASNLLKQQKYEQFFELFAGIEVLKGVFPKRKLFFFEEGLVFHNAWAKYYYEQNNPLQHQKHVNFMDILLNTYKSYAMTKTCD